MEHQVVNPKELAQAVAPFEKIVPWPGLFKIFVHSAILLSLLWLSWTNHSDPAIFWTGTILFSIFYPPALITSHDALHGTFTGIKLIDEIYPRLISYPLFWFHGVYTQVHKLHHKMNGSDLRDPERVQWTQAEYDQLSGFSKFNARHQWIMSLFVYAGLGLIIKTIIRGFGFWSKSKAMRIAFITDIIFIGLINAALFTFLISKGLLLKYFMFWFVTQYVAGMMLVYRAFVEHYGFWGKGDHFYDTQVRNCRNIETNAFGEWYFNGLCHHTIHHAFLKVPFYNLKKAHDAMDELYVKAGRGNIPYEKGYLRSALNHVGRTRVITENPTGGLNGTTPLKQS
jgi:fatty acid desaturase